LALSSHIHQLQSQLKEATTPAAVTTSTVTQDVVTTRKNRLLSWKWTIHHLHDGELVHDALIT